jgi:HSP20 family protein
MAALVRWNPWSELFDLHSQVDSLFNQALGAEQSGTGGEYANLPVDIRQTDEGFLIEASVPGFRPEDVEVTVDNGVLTIKGERRDEREQKKGNYVRRERRVMSVMRQIGLPQDVRADDITARFENGVLTLTLPRMEKSHPKRISVSATQSGESKTGAADQQKTGQSSEGRQTTGAGSKN